MEPVWGGEEDTAQTLRGICLLGLVTCYDIRRIEILRCLVEALTEPAKTVRAEAVRALAEMEGDEASLLLRLKARMGDKELEVTGLVFDALLKLERDGAVPLVAGFMQSRDLDVRAEAALALGGSRLPAAVDLLREAWGNSRDPDFREALLRALSASRQERAIDFLTGLLNTGRAADASMAMEALGLHRDSPDIRQKVEEAVQGSPVLLERFHKVFGG
jgi:HEAT repeat protein